MRTVPGSSLRAYLAGGGEVDDSDQQALVEVLVAAFSGQPGAGGGVDYEGEARRAGWAAEVHRGDVGAEAVYRALSPELRAVVDHQVAAEVHPSCLGRSERAGWWHCAVCGGDFLGGVAVCSSGPFEAHTYCVGCVRAVVEG